MIPCISQATTLSTPFEQDIPAFGRAGWPAVEIWLTKLEDYLKGHTIDEARSLLAESGVEAAGAATQGGLLILDAERRGQHWDHFRRRLEWLEALGVKTLVLTPDFAANPSGEAIGRAIQSLSEASEIARRHKVRLALEFPKTAPFCASLDTALALVAQAESEGLGVCLDVFHYYTGPSKFEDLAYLSPENLGWVQVCDLSGTPREMAGDSDRILPGDGDFLLHPIMEHLARLGYEGYVSLEVLNPQLWQVAAGAVADAGLRAMARLLEASAGASSTPRGGI